MQLDWVLRELVGWCLSLESHHLCDGGRQCLPTITSSVTHETLGHVWGHSLIDKLRDSEDWLKIVSQRQVLNRIENP